MKSEIRRDMQHNYLIIEDDLLGCGSYYEKMIEYNHLDGLLPYQAQSVNRERKLYYEISGLQQLSTVCKKFPLSYDQTVHMIRQLIEIIQQLEEYLLTKDDLLIDIDSMFVKLPAYELFLCYYPGYHETLQKQLVGFFEFLMSNVDYEDRDAVFLVYTLYMKCKEEGCTITQIRQLILQGASKESVIPQVASVMEGKDQICQPIAGTENQSLNQLIQEEPKKAMTSIPNPIPEKIRGQITERTKQPVKQRVTEKGASMAKNSKELIPQEKEVSYYPAQTFVFAGTAAVAAILILLLLLRFKILQDELSGKLNPIKFGCACAITILPCVYLILKIFSPEKKQTKMVSTIDYPISVDLDTIAAAREVQERSTQQQIHSVTKENSVAINDDSLVRELSGEMISQKTGLVQSTKETSEVSTTDGATERTMILNEPKAVLCAQLIPADTSEYDAILLSEFPFYIGTVKNRMNYSLKSSVISRYHAKVEKEGNHYYITDLNSTNGTYLNGVRLTPEESNGMVAGDKISFANIEFEFICPGNRFLI